MAKDVKNKIALSKMGERLGELRTALKRTQADFASDIGVSASYLSEVESGKSKPSIDIFIGISHRYNDVSPDWLIKGKGPMFASRGEQLSIAEGHANYAAIPLLDVRAAAGGVAVIDEAQVVDVLHFKNEWIHNELHANTSDLRLIFVSGDSMEPALRAGDILLLNVQDQTVRRDGIYVVRLDDTLIVKRLQKLPGGKLKVMSDNAAYEAFVLTWPPDDKTDVAVLGRVVWMGRRM